MRLAALLLLLAAARCHGSYSSFRLCSTQGAASQATVSVALQDAAARTLPLLINASTTGCTPYNATQEVPAGK